MVPAFVSVVERLHSFSVDETLMDSSPLAFSGLLGVASGQSQKSQGENGGGREPGIFHDVLSTMCVGVLGGHGSGACLFV